MRNTALEYTATLTTEECCNCGMMFAMPEDYRAKKVKNKTLFYCPAGHAQSYIGETFERKLENERRRAAAAEGRAERLEYRRRAAVGQVTKIKNRISRGVCPCCNRTFQDLARHMQSKHPDYSEVMLTP